MSPNSERPTTSVLFIDGNDTDRKFFADQLKRRSPDYKILEATDGQTGLALYRSRQVDCVVLEMDLPDQSGFKVLVELVPIASRPNVAVIMLTSGLHRGVREIARQNGAFAYFVKRFMSEEDLDYTIQRAIASVGRMPKEDRYRRVPSREVVGERSGGRRQTDSGELERTDS